MRIALLIGTAAELDSCHALYANTLMSEGHEVWIGTVNGLCSVGAEIRCPLAKPDGALEAFAPLLGKPEQRDFADIDLVWVLNYPHPSVEEAAWQLLWWLNQQVPFVNDVTGILMLNAKTALPAVVPPGHLPRTLVSNSFSELWAEYQTAPEATWLVKPPGGDAGADVYLLEPGSSNNRVLLQSMTGNTALTDLLAKGGLMGFGNRYCVLQEYLPHAEEKRVLIAAGRPVAQQLHRLAPGEHRGNTAHRAQCTDTALTADEERLCRRIGGRLLRHGIRFAGVDLAYPYVFEFNMVNPGGLDERRELGLPDRTPQTVRALLEAVGGR
ncbi:ATP-grasp domain-containing protein [Streptomyces sp. NPDC002446]